jgi:hypothetical protein
MPKPEPQKKPTRQTQGENWLRLPADTPTRAEPSDYDGEGVLPFSRVSWFGI